MALVIALAMVLTMMSISAFAEYTYTPAQGEFDPNATYYISDGEGGYVVKDDVTEDNWAELVNTLFTRSGEEDSGDSGDSGNTPSVTGASIELTQEPADYADSHTYLVYQIFTGDIGQDEEGNQILQNVKYGANYGDTGASVPKAVLDAVGEDARAYADTILSDLEGDPVAQLNTFVV